MTDQPTDLERDRDEWQALAEQHHAAAVAFATQLAETERQRDAARDTLLAIAGFVNGYHNDATTLTAAETLRAVADALGDPFGGTAAPPDKPLTMPASKHIFRA